MKACQAVFACCALACAAAAAAPRCIPSVTTVSGSHAPSSICSGDLIFSDEFTALDMEKWQHENHLSGGGNWEFQWYNNNRTNSFVENGNLHLRPSLMSDQFGQAYLSSATFNVEGGAPADRCITLAVVSNDIIRTNLDAASKERLWFKFWSTNLVDRSLSFIQSAVSECTNPQWWGCERTGTPTNILNPIKSARIRTVDSFRFAYGKVEVRAKMPAGDWLWPAIWLMPSHNVYGTWPASGEIDLTESRGNRQLMLNNVNIGAEQAGSALHFGPYPDLNGWERAHWTRNSAAGWGYDKQFHRYQLEWTPDYLRFSIDDVELGRITPSSGGFWEHGGFGNGRNIDNPWRHGTKMAPFDQKFYLIINLAIGGTNYFPDNAVNTVPKPWANNSPSAATDFWNGQAGWLPTWELNTSDNADLQVDYVRVYAL